jgi:hypothetical protein
MKMNDSMRSQWNKVLGWFLLGGVISLAYTTWQVNEWSLDRHYAANANTANAELRISSILLKGIAKSETVTAVHVNSKGNVIWINDKGRKDFPLLYKGQNISVIMTDEDAENHNCGFAHAMSEHASGTDSFQKVICQAKSAYGLVNVEVEAWTVPRGGMAFITIADNEDGIQQQKRESD